MGTGSQSSPSAHLKGSLPASQPKRPTAHNSGLPVSVPFNPAALPQQRPAAPTRALRARTQPPARPGRGMRSPPRFQLH
ncbi:hypothetical protein NDU88_010344 [Pleurodeles waltl]|uniref:Uncharacterized protein n=1 Tax=Pleurodeles waltl TaxID=8319 RepID=A0AAV7QU54_PLEWA|nr:hypothetical protein NDU88_010344 [Pleurodeles waltl]